MSSDIQAALELQLNDYASLAIVIAIGYDHCLTFSKEVTYVWKRPWTWVSVLFLLIRYGSYPAVMYSPYSVLKYFCALWQFIHTRSSKGNIIYLLGKWAYSMFWVGADMVMILRVYAMYNQSKFVLGVLLVIYIAEVAMFLVSCGIYSDPKYAVVSATKLLNAKVCKIVLSIQTWNVIPSIFQLVLDAILCVLVITRFLRDSFRMYRATGIWQLNKYMRLLAREGFLYFVVALLNGLITMLDIMPVGTAPVGWCKQVLAIAANVPIYTLAPRFVMNIRELYARDTQGRLDHTIDSGFGLLSGARECTAGSTTTGTRVVVEDQGPDGGKEIAEGKAESRCPEAA